MNRETRIKQSMKRAVTKIVINVMLVLLAILIIIGLLRIRSDTGVFGYTARIVISGSMEPTIEKNTLNIIELCDIEDIKVDDIICFRYDKDIIHRVIEINEVQGNIVLHTKGDNNETADNIEITEDMLLGKVVKTFNSSDRMLKNYMSDTGELDTVSLYKNMVIWLVIGALLIYAVTKIIKLIIIIVQAFKTKTSKGKSIRVLERDIEELYVIKELIDEINNNAVENKPETRFEYISNRVSRIRTEYAIRDIHKEITSMRSKIKNCYYLDNLLKSIENRDKENSTDESDNSAT